MVVANMPSWARWPMGRGVGSGIKRFKELKIPFGPWVPPLVPDDGPVVGWPPPLSKAVGMVTADPPLVAALPARALPQIAAANICKTLHDIHVAMSAWHSED